MFRISANGTAIPFRYSKEISLIANLNYLFDPTVCQSTTLRQVQKTKSVIFCCVCSCSFRHRRLPDLKHPTHPIYPSLFVREAETRAVGKVSGYNLHYQTIRYQQCTALFSLKNAKFQILRCQLFELEKNMVR